MDGFDQLAEQQRQQQSNLAADIKHAQLIKASEQTQEAVAMSALKIIEFLANHTSRTEVVNQLKSVSTPDVDKVVAAVESLSETIKSQEEVDLSEITKVMNGVLEQVSALPKTMPEIPVPVDTTEQLQTLTAAVKAVEEAIKGQETNVEAPVVNVPAPNVNVEAPDLKPALKDLEKALKAAISGIQIPEQTPTDISPIVKEQEKSNKLLKQIVDKPISSGGGGAGRATPYQDAAEVPQFVTLNPDSSVPTGSVDLATQIDNSSTPIVYIGKAPIGSSTSSAVWQIAKLDTTSGLVKTWADGNASFDNVFDDRTSLTYS